MKKIPYNLNIIIVVSFFVILGLLYCFVTPLWFPPDEERNYIYCEYIAHHKKLPGYSANPEQNDVSQGYHPPLFFIIASLLCGDEKELLEEQISFNDKPGFNYALHPAEETKFPFSGKARSAYLIRLFNIILVGACTLYLVYVLALLMFSDTAIAVLSALFVGTIPQYLHITASVSNEPMVVMVSTAFFVALVLFLKNPSSVKRQIACGFLMGCCILSKLTTIYYFPIMFGIIIWQWYRHKRNPLRCFFIMFGTAFLVSGWWGVSNWIQYNDPLLSSNFEKAQPYLLLNEPISLSYILLTIKRAFFPFWGHFGALDLKIALWSFWFYGFILFAGTLGFCLRAKHEKITIFQKKTTIIFLLFIAGAISLYVWMCINYPGAQGRYLYIVIAPAVIFLLRGVEHLGQLLRIKKVVFFLLVIVLILINIDAVLFKLNPYFSKPRLQAAVQQKRFCCPTIEINQSAYITQSFVAPANNLCAIKIMISNVNNSRKGTLFFKIHDSSDPNMNLFMAEYPLMKTQDFHQYLFQFPSIQNSKSRRFVLTISASETPEGKGVSLWHERGDVYESGNATENAKAVSTDLYFTAYCLPETAQVKNDEKKAVVLALGPYISLRELQLYFERSKSFRLTTPTQKKWLLVKNKERNRK
jgi:4-amino-4-deoxy-L-arabinose transferase-like glycosyltransferase